MVAEAAYQLVRTERFQLLVAKRTPELSKRYWHYGPEDLRFLANHDPSRKTHGERHSLEPAGPGYEISVRGRVFWRGASHAEARETLARTPRGLPSGAATNGATVAQGETRNR